MKFLPVLLALLTSSTALANGPWAVQQQDIKLRTQAVLEHKNWVNPALGSSITVLSAGTANTSAATTFTTFAAQPDFPRNLVLTPSGTTNVGAGTAVVSGTNIFGRAISENFSISANQGTATTGSKAFAKVLSILFPATTGSGVTLNVVAGTKLGLHRCMTNAGDLAWQEYGGVFDGTRPTIAADATHVESNTVIDASALDGAHNVDTWFVENFRCYP